MALHSKFVAGVLKFYNSITGASVLEIDPAGTVKIAGAGSIGGVGTGYKVARGTAALGGANPTTIVTGLATVVSFVAVLTGTAAPGLGTSTLTTNPNATPGSQDVYGWKPTSVSNPTLIASTGTDTFDWVAVGT